MRRGRAMPHPTGSGDLNARRKEDAVRTYRTLAAAAAAAALALAGAVFGTVVLRPGPAAALDNGLALTPPMGFNDWNSMMCRPEFNETTIRAIGHLRLVPAQGRRVPVREH